jgi:hypothetical protein
VEAAPARRRGDRVVLGTLGLEGIVVNVHDREAEVEVRGKRFRSLTTELRVLGGSLPKPESFSLKRLSPATTMISSSTSCVCKTKWMSPIAPNLLVSSVEPSLTIVKLSFALLAR